ncbi:MAG TPA: 2-C-methyl-D-erythritol 4-phosphate cytidylyltransferase [Eubacterium sp.]|nr:2-C-methyl-D-erythritol 4-phosphate cytidylyltransferase [Eubacterium sp.]
MRNKRSVAIVLSAGVGSRMNSDIPKQYIELMGKPIIYYTIKAFEESNVDGIVLVCAKEYIDYCKNEIVKKYGFKKVIDVVEGGSERYESVYKGLKVCNADIVLIHDGARACISVDVINKNVEEAYTKGAVVTGVKSKDTIKVSDDNGVIINTTNRANTWIVQTPQTFAMEALVDAYECMMNDINRGTITDDSMVMENYGNIPVQMLEGSYENIKITTPEDLIIAEKFLKSMNEV